MKTSSTGFLALAALAAIPFGAASAVEQAGVTAAVLGDIDFLSVLDSRVHKATGGEEIYLGDEISSAENSGMQLMLLDETIFTIGPETDLTIDEFVYDPVTGAGQMSASLTKGIFRFVAGNIAQGNPEDMEINLPAGTIGIRGTSGIISIINEKSAAIGNAPVDVVPGSVLVVLLETGGENIHESGLVVTGQGQSIELTTPGFGTVLAPDQPPTIPFLIEASYFTSDQAVLAPSVSKKDEPDDAQEGPEGEPGDRAAEGDNEPGNRGDGEGRPGGDDGPVTADGEPIEGDEDYTADGEPIEGDGQYSADGEPTEGDGSYNPDGEPLYYTSEGEPVYGDDQYFEGEAYEGDGSYSPDGEPLYYTSEGEPIYGDDQLAGGGYDDGGFYDDGGSYDDGRFYDDGGIGDDFFGDGGFGDEFFGDDGYGGDDFYRDYDGGFDYVGDDPLFDCPDCFNLDGPINGVATISDFADVFALSGTANYTGTRDFFQTLLSSSPVNIRGTVTFILSIDFDLRKLCFTACAITVDTASFGGNIADTTAVTFVDFSGRSGPAFNILTDTNLPNSNFGGTVADLFDFNDGTGNIVANNLAVLVTYDDGGGNQGGTPGFTPTDPRGGIPQ